MRHRCPHCQHPTTYQSFSGGREWYCDNCKEDGRYEPGEDPLPRAILLQTTSGRIQLRDEMTHKLEEIRERQSD